MTWTRSGREDGVDRETPGERGYFRPVVDPSRCHGEGSCADVCPEGVFAVGRVPDATVRALPLFEKVKRLAHGRRMAFTPRADACRACDLCIAACPTGAIRLVPVDSVLEGVRERVRAVAATGPGAPVSW